MWLRRALTVHLAAPPAEVARRLMAGLPRQARPRLFGHAGPAGFDFQSECGRRCCASTTR